MLKNAPSLWSKYKDTIKTDISDFQIPDYALLANEVKDNIHAVSLGPATVPVHRPATGAAVLLGDKEQMQADRRLGVLRRSRRQRRSRRRRDADAGEGAGAERRRRRRAGRRVSSTSSPARATRINDLNRRQRVRRRRRTRVSEIIDLDGTHEKNGYLLANWLEIPDDAATRRPRRPRSASMTDTGATLIVVILGERRRLRPADRVADDERAGRVRR